jgi:hypothetical protein
MSDNVVHWGWMLPIVKVDDGIDLDEAIEEMQSVTGHCILTNNCADDPNTFVFEDCGTLSFGEISTMRIPDNTEAAAIASTCARYGIHVSVRNAQIYISSYYNGADSSVAYANLEHMTGE